MGGGKFASRGHQLISSVKFLAIFIRIPIPFNIVRNQSMSYHLSSIDHHARVFYLLLIQNEISFNMYSIVSTFNNFFNK